MYGTMDRLVYRSFPNVGSVVGIYGDPRSVCPLDHDRIVLPVCFGSCSFDQTVRGLLWLKYFIFYFITFFGVCAFFPLSMSYAFSSDLQVEVMTEMINESSVEDLPSEDLPAEDSSEDLPAPDPPSEDLPAPDPPSEDLPAEDPSSEDLPAPDPPSEDLPSEDLPALDPPSEDLPAPDLPSEDLPAEDSSEDLPALDSSSELGGDSSELPVISDDEFILVDDEVVPAPLEADSPIEGMVVPDPDGADYPSLFSSAVPGLVISDDPPTNSPFYGSGWVTGTDSRLGIVTLYFPIDYQSGHWGVDSNGYLFNVTSSSMSGYLSGVYNNSVTASGFDYPRYRDGSSGDWTYYDLHLTPTDSNMEIAVDHVPRVPAADVLPYFIILLLGGVFVCFMRRS